MSTQNHSPFPFLPYSIILTVYSPIFSVSLLFNSLKMQLFPTQAIQFEVVYNLFELIPNLYLPNAYVVTQDRDGVLAHIKHKATEQTIGGFQLELDPVRKRLFDLIEQLQPKYLEQKFNPYPKRPQTLEKLLKQEEIKKGITVYVHNKLDQVLKLIYENKLPLCWQLERKVLVKHFLIRPIPEELQPELFFKKTSRGIEYRLQLKKGEKTVELQEREVYPIINRPAWLFIDYQLFRVAHINANMVKPFRTKDLIHIPRTSVKTYFQKFILKLAAKADFEAEGFELCQENQLSVCRLEAQKDLFSEQWMLAAKMVYNDTEFNWSDKKDRRSKLEFLSEEDIRIIQVIRDFPLEAKYIKKLQNFGLRNIQGSYFQLIDTDESNPFALIEWLIKHQQELKRAGFEITNPSMEDKSLSLSNYDLQFDAKLDNDWFDLHGEIKVGDFLIPFLALAKYIRENNRFYPLPDGQFFLIPQEWMARFGGLVQFARKKGDNLLLAKSQFTLLDELGIETDGKDLEEVEDFKVSKHLKATLRSYQLEGVKWLVRLYHNQLGACLADDMGLGKTLQTIAALLHAKAQLPEKAKENNTQQLSLFQPAKDASFLQALNALIVLPASLVFNWENEISKFAPHLTIYKHTGPKRHKDIRLIARFDIILTTYQTALRDVALLSELEYEYIVLDESQQIKNKDSKIFKAINQLQANHKISLSGTPIENSLSDLWAQMQFINPELLGSFRFFRQEFIQPIEKLQDEEKKERLRNLVQPYLLRRTKEEVAKDLPPLSTNVFYSEMTTEQKKLYEKEKSAIRNYLLDNFHINDPKYKIMVLQSLTKLRQLANHPKLIKTDYEKGSGKFHDVLEQWEVIQKGGHKALFFSSFVKYLELFRTQFDSHKQPYAWLTGSLNAKQREKSIQNFMDDPKVQSFLISIKSGGTGLNLTAADYVFILDPWWNPTTEQQAIARAHRIGQQKNVIAIKFITKESIEEKIMKLQEKKSKLAADIINQNRKADFSKVDLEYLLE